MYCELIDSLFITRLIVSANISAILNCFTFGHFFAYGMLSVNTISVRADSCTRKEAGSDITQWLAMARTDLAPASSMMLAALVIVPAVSTISSINTTFLPSTSPMICIDATSLAFSRDLLQSTNGTPRYLEKVLARFEPPTSGVAITRFSSCNDWM